jgi:hypothetical protein
MPVHMEFTSPTLKALCAAILILLAARPSDGAEADNFAGFIQPTLRDRCVRCHGENGRAKGKVDLLKFGSAADLGSDPELLTDLIGVIDRNEMPPEDEKQPTPDQRRRLLAGLKAILREASTRELPAPTTPIRRMNRFQYNNAVQDLFDLKVVVFTLPERMLREHGAWFQPASGKMPDNVKVGSRPLGKSQLIERRLANVGPFPQDLRAENGFDNRADHLSISPLLLESFLKVARSIVESPDFNEKNCGIWKNFFAPPEKGANVNKEVRGRLRGFLTRAFRRPTAKDLLDRYTNHVVRRIEGGASFTDAMKAAAAAALASPRFFYLYDRGSDVAKAPANNDDLDLASRLSFFLWGSIPDERLIALAAEGNLHRPAVLRTEVDRMLNDRRLKRFCDSFPSQWLQLERIITSVPDPRKNPDFYFAKYRASMHMMLEPLLLFETILVEDRPILELIDSDFSYRSELLEAWYDNGGKGGRRPPTVIPFKRVPVNDRRQGGVITTAAVMTMTSSPVRTQPVTRGSWIASVIFNAPPDPPPANVPPLEDNAKAGDENLTLRERFAAHRDNAACAGCHNRIDPLGFALENYGPTGIWRDRYENGRKVDAAGKLFRKHKFNDPVEFKNAILAEKGRFVRAFAKHLLSFALGREAHPADEPALDDIVEHTKADNHRLRGLIRQIVLSEPFLGTRPEGHGSASDR